MSFATCLLILASAIIAILGGIVLTELEEMAEEREK